MIEDIIRAQSDLHQTRPIEIARRLSEELGEHISQQRVTAIRNSKEFDYSALIQDPELFSEGIKPLLQRYDCNEHTIHRARNMWLQSMMDKWR